MIRIPFQKGTIKMGADGLHHIELIDAQGKTVYQATIDDAEVKAMTEEYPASSLTVVHIQTMYYANFSTREVELREIVSKTEKSVTARLSYQSGARRMPLQTMVGAWFDTEQEAIAVLHTILERSLRSAESSYQNRLEQYDTFIRKYPAAIPEREPGKPVRLSMVIMSHLSDIQTGFLDGQETRRRCNFIKWLLIQQPTTSLEVDIDALWEEFLTTRFA